MVRIGCTFPFRNPTQEQHIICITLSLALNSARALRVRLSRCAKNKRPHLCHMFCIEAHLCLILAEMDVDQSRESHQKPFCRYKNVLKHGKNSKARAPCRKKAAAFNHILTHVGLITICCSCSIGPKEMFSSSLSQALSLIFLKRKNICSP